MDSKVRAELMQAILTERAIKELEDKIQTLEMRLLPNGIDYSKDKIVSSPSDQMSKVCAEMADLEARRDRLVESRTEVAKIVESWIDMIGGYTSRHILTARYLHFKTFPEIAKEMHCSEDNVYRLHRLACQYLATKMHKN